MFVLNRMGLRFASSGRGFNAMAIDDDLYIVTELNEYIITESGENITLEF